MGDNGYKREYIGHMYNDWEIISTDVTRDKSGHILFLCKCHCPVCERRDNENIVQYVQYSRLKTGKAISCIHGSGYYHIKKYNISQRKPNEYDLSGEYGVGYLRTRNGIYEFYFDKEDYDLIKDYTWIKTSAGYARAFIWNGNSGSSVFMHRLILGIQDNSDKVVDHKNHNRLDNRKANIRTCTHIDNALNDKRMNPYNGSGLRFVDGKWMVRFRRDGKWYYGGVFDNYDDALAKRIEMEPDIESEFQYYNSISGGR